MSIEVYNVNSRRHYLRSCQIHKTFSEVLWSDLNEIAADASAGEKKLKRVLESTIETYLTTVGKDSADHVVLISQAALTIN